jgi:hypothetical protein
LREAFCHLVATRQRWYIVHDPTITRTNGAKYVDSDCCSPRRMLTV